MSPQTCINLQNRVWTVPNQFNRCLAVEAGIWNQIIRRGGLEMTLGFQKKRRYEKPPWVNMPPEGERLNKLAGIALPAVEQVDNTILDFTVPVGWDGVLTNVMMTLSPPGPSSGFVEGSGQVVWRLKVGERWIPDFSDVLFELNDLKNPHSLVGGYIRILSQQRVQIFASLGAGALAKLDGADRLNAGVAGWLYPKR